MEIQESNKLIAKFMNEEYRNGTVIRYSDTARCRVNPKGEVGHPIKYDASWDWLMPVVENIESVVFAPEEADIFIGYKACTIEYMNEDLDIDLNIQGKAGKTKLEGVYNLVVQFIEWYNSQDLTTP